MTDGRPLTDPMPPDDLPPLEDYPDELEAEGSADVVPLFDPPARDEMPEAPPPEFPTFVFPGAFQPFIGAVAKSTETPIDAVGPVILGMVSAAYGTQIRLHVKEGYETWCHDFVTLIAPSSLGKTPLFKLTSPPLRAIETELQNEKADEVRVAKAQISALEAKRSKRTRAFKADECEQELAVDLEKIDREIECLQRIRLPQLLVSDVTPEALVKILAGNDGAAAMVSAETPLWSKLSGRSSGKPPDLEAFLSAYDGEFYRCDRVTRDQDHVEEARLAIVVATQDAVVHDLAARPDILDRGLLYRFTFCRAPNVTEADLVDEDVPVPESLRSPYDRTLRAWGLRFRRNPPEPFRLSPEAAERYRTWRNRFKLRHRLEAGDLHDIAPFARKLENKVLRWSALLHPLWTDTPGVIEVEDVGRGLALVDWALAHHRELLGLISEGPTRSLARQLEKYFASRKGQTITERHLKRNFAPFGRAEPETQRAALEELEADAVVKLAKRQGPEGGRPSPVVIVL